MKKLFFLIFFFVSFLFLTSPSPARGACSSCQKSSQTAGIFSDPAFSQATNNFSSGQMVYIRVETAGGGERKNELRVLDSGKKTIQTMSLARSGTGPYVYTTSFPSPVNPGVYYVDIKIEGEGSSFASQKNINVGEGNGVTSVSTAGESGIPQKYQMEPTSTLTPLPTKPSSLVTSPVPPRAPQSFHLRIIEIFRRIFSYLTSGLS